MSNKKLEKVVVERGQHRGHKDERKHFHHTERQVARAYISDVLKNLDVADEEVIDTPSKTGNWFYGGVKVVYRWLEKQIGRPWSQVHSDLMAQFDSPDLRDQVHRYIVSDIESPQDRYYSWNTPPQDPTTSYHRYDFYVDEAGLLQRKRVIRRPYHYDKIPHIDVKQLANWLNGRLVSQSGKKLF